MSLGLSGVLLLGMAARSAGVEKRARPEAVLEIMSLDEGDATLRLSWPWGGMAVNHVMSNDHDGPFRAVVESSGKGVRITFDGRGEEPFVASAGKIRIIYRVAGKKAIDFAAEAVPGWGVRVRQSDRRVTQGRRIVIGLGEPTAKGVANVSVEGKRD
jgi:hypothetical protein